MFSSYRALHPRDVFVFPFSLFDFLFVSRRPGGPLKEHVWRHLFFGVTGCLGGMLLMAFSLGHNVVTRDDMPALIAQYSPYTADAEAIKVQLAQQAQEIGGMQTQVQQLELGVAQISEKLGISARSAPADPSQ